MQRPCADERQQGVQQAERRRDREWTGIALTVVRTSREQWRRAGPVTDRRHEPWGIGILRGHRDQNLGPLCPEATLERVCDHAKGKRGFPEAENEL